jgi:hypothetical protein
VIGPDRRAFFWKGVVHVKADIVDVTAHPAVARKVESLYGARDGMLEELVRIKL